MTKIEELELELAARKIVEGTPLVWVEVLRDKHTKGGVCHTLPGAVDDYELALGIIECKPVWRWDKYYNVWGRESIANDDGLQRYWSHCSWNPPKHKTVMVELLREDIEVFVSETCTTGQQLEAFNNMRKACRKALENQNEQRS